MSMATVRADVCYRYDSAEGCEIVIKLPQDVGRRLAVDVCDAVERAAFTVLASEPERACEGLPRPARSEPEPAQTALEYVPFPTEGTVTMKEITAAWKISQATYYRHLDIYPNPLKPEGLAKNATARFDAAAARAFECGHVERRRREVRG